MGASRSTVARIGAAAVALTALAACKTQGTTETGAARPDGRAIPVEVTAGRITPPPRWPDACSLLTEAELSAVLPSLRNLERRPEPVKPYIPVQVPGGPGADRQAAPRGRCTYTMALPLVRERHIGDREHGTGALSVTLTAVGSPEVIARVYAAQKAGDERSHSVAETGRAASCHRRSIHPRARGDIICRKGPVAFAVRDEGFEYIGFEGVGRRSPDFAKTVTERVLMPVVETVAADLPDG